MSFAILRTKKIRTESLKGAQEHNLRQRFSPNIDKARTHLNEILIDVFDIATNKNLESAIDNYYEEKKVSKKNASVPMMEFMLTASPQFFEKASKADIERWKLHQMEFIQQKWGDAVKFVVLHLDEKSPHIHVMISTEQTTVKKYKNQHGEFFKESCSLNVKRFNREYLRELQTEYAQHNKIFGLRRGLRGSNVKHQSLKSFYRKVQIIADRNYAKRALDKFKKVASFFGFVRQKDLTPVADDIYKAESQLEILSTAWKNYPKLAETANKKQQQLDKELEELEQERKELAEQRKIYKEAINARDIEENYVQALKDEIELLKKRIKELTPSDFDVSNKDKSLKSKINRLFRS